MQPGRIEVVGKHTDYAGGRSLLGAINKGFCVVTVEREDTCCRFFSTTFPDSITVDMANVDTTDTSGEEQGHWANYPRTAVKRLARNFGSSELKGIDFAVVGDFILTMMFLHFCVVANFDTFITGM